MRKSHLQSFHVEYPIAGVRPTPLSSAVVALGSSKAAAERVAAAAASEVERVAIVFECED